MTRRQWLRLAGIGSLGLLANSLPPMRNILQGMPGAYKGVTYLPPAYRAIRVGISGFVEHLQQAAPTAMDIAFFDSASLMKADEQLPAMIDRDEIQFMFHATTYISKHYPILGIFNLPGVCNHLFDHGERTSMESPLWKLVNDRLAEHNLFMLTTGGGVVEPEYLWSNRKRAITKLHDLSGKRCRIVGHEAKQVLQSFGVRGIRIPSSQTYLALQRGGVDGILANISTVIGRNLYEQLDFCYKMPITSFALAIFMRRDRWDKMDPKEKEAFWKAGSWYDQNQMATINFEYYPKEYWPIIATNDIAVIDPTSLEKEKFFKACEPIWKWWRSLVGDSVGKRVIELAMGEA